MGLNATELKLAIMANRNMKHFKRTWWNTSRAHDQMGLSKWYNKVISLSYIDDLRGTQKRGGWIWRRQHGFPFPDGTYRGSESRCQFKWKLCMYLANMGIQVYRPAWSVAKKFWRPPKPETATLDKHPASQDKTPPQHGKNPYLEPGSRRSLGLPEIPPFDPKKA